MKKGRSTFSTRTFHIFDLFDSNTAYHHIIFDTLLHLLDVNMYAFSNKALYILNCRVIRDNPERAVHRTKFVLSFFVW